MSKKTIYLFGILLTIILGTILYYFLCCKPCWEAAQIEADETESSITKPEEKAATLNNFSVIDQDSGLGFKDNSNFNFKGSNFSIIEPVSEGLKNEIERLARYLKDNQGKIINITGNYTSNETNNTAFPNLGLARANSIKNYFVLHGIPTKIINTYATLDENLIPDDANTYYGPVSYKIETVDVNDTEAMDSLKALRDEIIAKPLVLYFDSGAASIKLTTEQREKVAKMSKYLDKADNALIQVIGHTDNTGNRDSNIRLGENRAVFAKNYLVQNGISTGKIKTSSKGPDVPIADNATDNGRAKNRRVVVTLN